MIKDITLVIDGKDFSTRLSTYSTFKEVTYKRIVTDLMGNERAYGRNDIPTITFSLLPCTEEQAAEDYSALGNHPLTVRYTDTHSDSVLSESMRVASDLSKAYALSSIDGHVYYNGSPITLKKTVRG